MVILERTRARLPHDAADGVDRRIGAPLGRPGKERRYTRVREFTGAVDEPIVVEPDDAQGHVVDV